MVLFPILGGEAEKVTEENYTEESVLGTSVFYSVTHSIN